MEATATLRGTPCRTRLHTRRDGRTSKVTRTERIETVGEHEARAAILDKADWSLYRIRVLW